MSLGNKLRTLRESESLTMEELANKFNDKFNATVGKSMISRWESGKTIPLNTYLTYYAKYFNVTLDYLLGINIKNPIKIEKLKDENTSFKELVVMGFNGLDVSKMSDDERESYYNDLVDMMNMVTLKYQNKKKK